MKQLGNLIIAMSACAIIVFAYLAINADSNESASRILITGFLSIIGLWVVGIIFQTNDL